MDSAARVCRLFCSRQVPDSRRRGIVSHMYGYHAALCLIAARKLPCCTAARLDNHAPGAVVPRASFRFAQDLLHQRCFVVAVIACLIRYEARTCLLVAVQVLLRSSWHPPTVRLLCASALLRLHARMLLGVLAS